MLVRLSRLLRLDPDDTRLGLVLGGLFFSLTSSYTLAKTARDALFLARLPADLLPFVYLGSGVVTLGAAWMFTRYARHHRSGDILENGAWVSALVLAAFAFVSTGDSRGSWLHPSAMPIALYLWVNVYGVLLLSQFWAFTTSVSNPRQAKRTLGLVGTLGISGGLVGGLATVPLAHFSGTAALLAGASLLTLICVPLARWRLNSVNVSEEEEDAREAEVKLFRMPYVRWLALAALFSVLVTAVLDYQLKIALQQRSTDPRAIAAFFGSFHVATNLAALLLQLLFTGWALQRIGAGWTSSVLPIGVMIGSIATLATTNFWAVVATRLWDQVLRNSTHRSATELFYFPLTPMVRRRLRAWIEAGLDRAGDALAGLLLIALRWSVGSDPVSLSVLVVVLVVGWVVCWLGVRSGYVAELARNVRRMNLDLRSSRVSLRESAMLRQMTDLLKSPFERHVLHALEMLEQHAPERLERHILELLEHPTPAVRARAVEIAGSRRIEALRSRLDRLMEDPATEVRFQALRARCLLGEGDAIETLGPYVSSTDPEIGRLALCCVAELAPSQEVNELREMFERLLREGGEAAHERVAIAIGYRRADAALYDLLPPLLRSRSTKVRRAALLSAGQAGIRTAVPRVIEALADRATVAAARSGLVAFGERVVGTLGDYLADRGVPIAIRRELPRVLGQISSDDAVTALLRCRDREDVRLSYRVLKALNRIRAADRSIVFPVQAVTEDIDYDVRSYLTAMVHYRACPIGGSRSAERLLCIALNERMDQSLNRVFRRLALLYSPTTTFAAYRGILSDDARSRGNALEYLENALDPPHTALLLPLVDDQGEEQRLALAESRYGLRFYGFRESLEELMAGDDPWLRSCALFVAGSQRDRSMAERIEANLAAMNAVVRETAQWAKRALGTA